jgi:hypothetical protein
VVVKELYSIQSWNEKDNEADFLPGSAAAAVGKGSSPDKLSAVVFDRNDFPG